jgi:hypothetical protein
LALVFLALVFFACMIRLPADGSPLLFPSVTLNLG